MMRIVVRAHVLQVVGEIDIMLPSDGEVKARSEFPLKAHGEGHICAQFTGIAMDAGAYTYRYIGRIGFDTSVITLLTEAEEVKLRHYVYVHQLVGPLTGTLLRYAIAIGFVAADTMGHTLCLQRPALVKAITKRGSVGFAHIHEYMILCIAHIVPAPSFYTEFAAVHPLVRSADRIGRQHHAQDQQSSHLHHKQQATRTALDRTLSPQRYKK